MTPIFKTLWGALFFTLAPGTPVSAATVGFLVLETGEKPEISAELSPEVTPANSPEVSPGSFESSALWETCLLDVFFEAGHVVSNSPILRLARISGADLPGKAAPEGEFPRELGPELEDAALGGVDYLILALLSYPQGETDPKAKPKEVSLRVYRSLPGGRTEGPYRFVYEGFSPLGYAGPQPGASSPQGEADQAKRLIRGLIPHIKD
ncbi:MAG: hypothetical protein LBQ46_04280 [Treponema sp.]|nr:hypothetical protein [Treponema sp.]